MKRTIVILLIAVSASGCCKKKSPEQLERERVAKAEASAKKAAEKAEMAEVKKRCGEKFGTTGWESTCHDLVRAKLFQPSSASFSFLMSVVRDDDKTKCRQTYSSTVESKNAFGTIIEHRFQCTFNPKKDWVTLDYIKMN